MFSPVHLAQKSYYHALCCKMSLICVPATFKLPPSMPSILILGKSLYQVVSLTSFNLGKLLGWNSLFSAAKLGAGTIGLLTVDIVGRKPLLIGGGIIMAACQAVVAVLMGHYLPTHKTKSVIPSNVSNGLLAAICIFVGMFSLSWGKRSLRFGIYIFCSLKELN